MKLLAPAAMAALFASTTLASSFEIGNTGVALNTEVVGEYLVDAENMTVVVTPTLAYTWQGAYVAASTDLTIYNDELVVSDTFNVLPTIDFEAEYNLNANARVYGEVSYDLEAEERSDVTLGVAFSF